MKRTMVLVKKEIRDILRDKKTLVIMIVVPMLLYPLIIIGMSLGISMFMQSQGDETHTVSYDAACWAEIRELKALYEEHAEEIDWKLEFAAAEQIGTAEGTGAEVDNGADVYLQLERDLQGALQATLFYTSTEQGSNGTRQALEDLLELYREELVEEKLAAEGLDASILYPVTYELKDSASLTESFGMDIGGSIGMMLMVTILLGAVYPAIDATAGEKERGTLETLLTLPVTNFQMIFSKFISVAVFACVTAVLSMVSLGGSVLFLIFGIADSPGSSIFEGMSVIAILPYIPLLLLALIATALLATALCMCFCVFAKSFKEANNYVTPVLLIVMFASMTAMIPSFRLDYRTALIPVVNVSLMIKEIISGGLSFSLISLIVCVNFGYSILIAWVLAKLYDSEAILFSDGFRSFRIFQKRSDIRKGTMPDIGDVVVAVTVLLLLLLYAGSAVAVRTSALTGTAANQLLILAVPLFVVWYMKSDVKRLFSLRMPRRGTVPGSVVLYLGAYCLIAALAAVLTGLLPESTSNLQETFVPIVEAPLMPMLFVVAVMPAVGEEILFRGFLFGSLRERLKNPILAVVLSGLVFGAFHMSLVKLLPTFLLGVLFAGIVHVTGSIYVTMALHFLNNVVSMLAMKYPDFVGRIIPFLTKERLTVQELAGLLVVGGALAAAGVFLLQKSLADGTKAAGSKAD